MGLEEAEEDIPRLSAQTLVALQEFLSERENQSSSVSAPESDRDAELERNHGAEPQKVGGLPILPEDWRLSQFWYDCETARTVAHELDLLSKQRCSPIACVSCPSLYIELKDTSSSEVHLFEYDERFEIYGSDFTFYDYNFPEKLPKEHQHAFQVVVADPPYLSKECIEKTAQTMKLLANDGQAYFLLLTGAVQRDLARDLLGATPCAFRPSHRNKLGNEFMLFINYDPCERLGGWARD